MKDNLEKTQKKSYAISGFAVLIIALVLISLLFKNFINHHSILNYFYLEPAIFFAVPLFFLILWFTKKRDFWAYILWLGFLSYLLHFCFISLLYPYKYITPFLYLSFFLILYTFVIELKSINSAEIAEKLKDKIPRKTTMAFFVLGIITIIGPLLLSLYAQIYHGYLGDRNIVLYYYERILNRYYFIPLPRYLISNPIVDLGFLLPLYGIIIYQLIRKRDWGYILAPIIFIKSAVPLFSVFHYRAIETIYFKKFEQLYSSFIQIVIYGFSVITTRRFSLGETIIGIKLILFVLFTLTAAGLTIFFLVKLWKSGRK